jgi:hypothetical protein
MAYQFQAVDISVFDYHEMLPPLTAPNLTKPDFNFLVDEALYNNAYKAVQPVASPHFEARPLRWRTLNYHHFWKYYQTIWYPGGQPDFWKLQMPFACKPTQASVEVSTGSTDFKGQARASVFLSALGWSSVVDIGLRGKMSPEQLRDFVGGLRDQKSPLFSVTVPGGRPPQPVSLPQVFQLLSNQLRNDVYVPNLVETVRVKRYMLITLSQFSGEEVRYYLSPSSGVKQMPDAGRRVMHSILSGAPVPLEELQAMEAKAEGRRRYLLTRFSEADFALTYFNHGTLLFMQQTAHSTGDPSRRKAMRCHSANIRNYLVMMHALSWFYRDTANEKNAKVVELRGHVKTDIEMTAARFVTPFSLTFGDNFGPLKKA